jgi:alpha-tubulin suppressor-like RCC1 family protein
MVAVKDEFANLIYAWGNNDRGQLGVGIRDDKVTRPKLMPSSSLQVAKIACGINHTVCLTTQGLVFHWGLYYLNAKRGEKEMTGSATQPKLMESLARCVTIDIAAGSG